MEKKIKKIILICICFIAACLPIKAEQNSSEQGSSIKSGFVIVKFNGRDYLLDRELGVICYNSRMATRELVCVRIKSK